MANEVIPEVSAAAQAVQTQKDQEKLAKAKSLAVCSFC